MKVLLQLKANMLLCATMQLERLITCNPQEALKTKILTYYGIVLSVNGPLVLLKMVLDFDASSLEYTELFR